MGLLDSFFPGFAQDTVAVFTQDFNQVFPNARPIKAVIKEDSKVMEHPVETGAIITDHRIVLPVEVELSLILLPVDYQDTYAIIRQLYINGDLLVVQTRAGVYENQIISSMPHQEDPDQFDTITISLRLKQVLFVTAKYGVVPKKPSNSSRVDRGVQQAGTPKSTTYATQIFAKRLNLNTPSGS